MCGLINAFAKVLASFTYSLNFWSHFVYSMKQHDIFSIQARMLMRQNVKIDVSKDRPLDKPGGGGLESPNVSDLCCAT